MVDKHTHDERHFGYVPLAQSQTLSALATVDNEIGDQLKNVTDPTDPQDVVTLSYLESHAGGGEFITGDSRHFRGSIGDWTGTGVSDEDDDSWPIAGGHYAKQTSVDVNDGFGLSGIVGPFYTGVCYQAVVAMQFEDPVPAGTALVLQLGNGVDETAQSWANAGPVNTGRWALYFVRWIPEADSDTAQIYLGRVVIPDGLGTVTMRLGFAALGAVRPQDQAGFALIAEPQSATEAPDFEDSEMAAGPALVVRPTLDGTTLGRGEADEGVVWDDGFTGSPGGLRLIGQAGGLVGFRDVAGTWGFEIGPVNPQLWTLDSQGIPVYLGEDQVGFTARGVDSATGELIVHDWSDMLLSDNSGKVWIIDGGGP